MSLTDDAAEEAGIVAAAAAEVVTAEADEAAAPEPVPEMTRPWSSTEATAAKLVLMPNTALKASA